MGQAIALSIVSACIALIAATLSLIAIWKTHFSTFRPISTVGDLRLRIYPLKTDNGRWYISSFDVPVSVTNEGARPGRVMGLRLCIHFPDLPIPNNREIFYPVFEVNTETFEQINGGRSEWLSAAVIAGWMPFIVLPKATVTKHLIFETRWDEPVIQKRVSCSMELYIDTKKAWTEIGKWQLGLGTPEWSELVNVGSSFSVAPDGALELEGCLYPPDLHRYTGTKEIIPDGGFGAGPCITSPERKAEEDLKS